MSADERRAPRRASCTSSTSRSSRASPSSRSTSSARSRRARYGSDEARRRQPGGPRGPGLRAGLHPAAKDPRDDRHPRLRDEEEAAASARRSAARARSARTASHARQGGSSPGKGPAGHALAERRGVIVARRAARLRPGSLRRRRAGDSLRGRWRAGADVDGRGEGPGARAAQGRRLRRSAREAEARVAPGCPRTRMQPEPPASQARSASRSPSTRRGTWCRSA